MTIETRGFGPAAFWRDVRTVPNLLSLSRMVAIFAALALFLAGFPWAAIALGIAAGATDYLDGWLARRLGRVTELGALLDGVADLFVCLAGFGLAVETRVWPLYLLLLWGVRDIGVTALRASAAQQGFALHSIFLGKIATNVLFYSFLVLALDILKPWGDGNDTARALHWAGLAGAHLGLALFWAAAFFYVAAYVRRYRSVPRSFPGSRGEGAGKRVEEQVEPIGPNVPDGRDLDDPSLQRAFPAVDHETPLAKRRAKPLERDAAGQDDAREDR